MFRVRYRASVWLLLSQAVIGTVCLFTFDVWSLPALSVMTVLSEPDLLARTLAIVGAAVAVLLYYNVTQLRMALHVWIFTVCGMFWFSLYFYVLQMLQQSESDPLAAYERHGELIYPVTGPHWPSPLFHDRLWEGPVLSGARDLVFHAASGNAGIPAVEALVILAPPVLFLAWVLALTVTTTWLSDRDLAARQRRGLLAEARCQLAETRRRQNEAAEGRQAELAEAQRQDEEVAQHREEALAAAARQRHATFAAAAEQQETALTEAKQLGADAARQWDAVLAEVARQEAEAAKREDVPGPGAATERRAETHGRPLWALIATARRDKAAAQLLERPLRELDAGLMAAAREEEEAVKELDAALADAARLEEAAATQRDAALDEAPRLEKEAAQELEAALAAAARDWGAEANRRLTDAGQRLEAAANERPAALAEAKRQQETAAQQRREAPSRAVQRQELAAAARRAALARAVEQVEAAAAQCELALAAAAREEEEASRQHETALAAATGVQEQLHEAELARTEERRRAARATAAELRQACLDAVAKQEEATRTAVANRYRVLLPALAKEKDATSWEEVSQRLADHRPFTVRATGVSGAGLLVDCGPLGGIIPSSDIVWDDRPDAQGDATTLLGKNMRVVAVKLLPAGALQLSEREAVEEQEGWLALWDHHRRGDVFEVDVIESEGDRITVGYGAWVWALPEPGSPPVTGWMGPADFEKGSQRRGPGRMKVQVTSYDRDRGDLVISQRAAWRTLLSTWRLVGESFRGTITGITEFGVFVNILPGRDGLVHTSEMAWDRLGNIDLQERLQVGQQLPVVVLGVQHRRDDPRPRISLSARRAAWPLARETLRTGQVVPGLAFDVRAEEVLLRLPGPALARVHRRDIVGHLRAGGNRDGYITDVITQGDIVPVKIMDVREDLVRFDASYREGRAEASADGSWTFDQRGRVIAIPDDVRAEFPDESAALEPRWGTRREEAGASGTGDPSSN